MNSLVRELGCVEQNFISLDPKRCFPVCQFPPILLRDHLCTALFKFKIFKNRVMQSKRIEDKEKSWDVITQTEIIIVSLIFWLLNLWVAKKQVILNICPVDMSKGLFAKINLMLFWSYHWIACWKIFVLLWTFSLQKPGLIEYKNLIRHLSSQEKFSILSFRLDLKRIFVQKSCQTFETEKPFFLINYVPSEQYFS